MARIKSFYEWMGDQTKRRGRVGILAQRLTDHSGPMPVDTSDKEPWLTYINSQHKKIGSSPEGEEGEDLSQDDLTISLETAYAEYLVYVNETKNEDEDEENGKEEPTPKRSRTVHVEDIQPHGETAQARKEGTVVQNVMGEENNSNPSKEASNESPTLHQRNPEVVENPEDMG